MKGIKPDDYFNNGAIELARFGKQVIMRNNMSSSQHKQLAEHLKLDYFDEIQRVNEKISIVKEKVLRCDPVQLLSFSSDIGLMTFLNLFSEFQVPSQDVPIARATEYIQSILVSSPCNDIEHPDDDPSALFHEILKEIEDLHSLIQNFYICWGAKLEDLVPGIEDGILKSVMEAQLMYQVRGQRYQVFEIEYYQKLLAEHDTIFRDAFGISSEDITNGISKLQYSLTQGKADAFNQLHAVFEKFQDYEEDDKEAFFIEHKQEGEDFYHKVFGTQLRDVYKITQWPEDFIKELSWELNDETGFFNDSPFSGWPIVDLPVFKRPFIRINNISYCFDYYSFIDNFYRAIQKAITRLRPDYRWSDCQQAASEKMVESIFQSLLPSCVTYRSNYYPINNSIKQAAENDLIVLYDDTLIIVEVKAGSFVYTPPILDFDAHIKSYKSLIEKADWQCQRTKDYLTGQLKPSLYDVNHEVKATIDMNKIVSIFMVSVTIDNINYTEKDVQDNLDGTKFHKAKPVIANFLKCGGGYERKAKTFSENFSRHLSKTVNRIAQTNGYMERIFVKDYVNIDLLCGTVNEKSDNKNLNPSIDNAEKYNIKNATSAVTLWRIGDNKYLLPGDATVHTIMHLNTEYANLPKDEQGACAECVKRQRAIMTAPHHGSDHSSKGRKYAVTLEPKYQGDWGIYREFLYKYQPSAVTISAGRKYGFGHPGPEFVKATDCYFTSNAIYDDTNRHIIYTCILDYPRAKCYGLYQTNSPLYSTLQYDEENKGVYFQRLQFTNGGIAPAYEIVNESRIPCQCNPDLSNYLTLNTGSCTGCSPGFLENEMQCYICEGTNTINENEENDENSATPVNACIRYDNSSDMMVDEEEVGMGSDISEVRPVKRQRTK